MSEEQKAMHLAPVEVEIKASEDERGVINGYAAYFDNIDRHGDILKSGSLNQKTVKVPLLLNHDTGDVVGHAIVTEDEKGYSYTGMLAVDSESDTLRERARYAYALVKEGHIRHNSIGFIPMDTKLVKEKNKLVRHITQVDLGEVSLVPVPANPKAENYAVKSYSDADLETLVEDIVRRTVKSFTREEKVPEAEVNPYRAFLRRRYPELF